jgi:nucleoside phosphorylase
MSGGLAIRPVDPIVVLTALPVEYTAIRQHVDKLQAWQHPSGTVFEEGVLDGTQVQVVLAMTGEGNNATAVLTERANATYRPRALLFVGVAGALKDDLTLGDVVVATRVHAYHGGKETGEGFLARPRSWDAAHPLEQLARHLAVIGKWTLELPTANQDSPPKVEFRPIAAGEVVLNSRRSPLAAQLHGTYNDAAAIEMESAGASHAGHLGALPVLTIRAISDLADGSKDLADADGSQVRAFGYAAAFATGLIKLIAETRPGQADGTVLGRTEPGQLPPWRPLPAPLPVTGLADLGLPRIIATAAIELHLVPADQDAIVEVRRLAAIKPELAELGRAKLIFTSTEGLQTGEPALVTGTEHGAGLAVTRSGQRTAWLPLPSDSLGAILDPADIIGRILQMLGCLLEIDVPNPAECGLAVGVTSRGMLSAGKVSDLPRFSTRPRTSMAQLRVPAADVLPFAVLAPGHRDVAEELTARLTAEFAAPTGAPAW